MADVAHPSSDAAGLPALADGLLALAALADDGAEALLGCFAEAGDTELQRAVDALLEQAARTVAALHGEAADQAARLRVLPGVPPVPRPASGRPATPTRSGPGWPA